MNKTEKHVFKEFIKHLKQRGAQYDAESKKSKNENHAMFMSGMASGYIAAANELDGLIKGLKGDKL